MTDVIERLNVETKSQLGWFSITRFTSDLEFTSLKTRAPFSTNQK